MDAFQKFYEYVEPGISGVPERALQRTIRDAAIEVFKETGFWRDGNVPAVSLVLNQPLYTIVSPQPESQICDIERIVDQQGGAVSKRERDWLDSRYKTWETDLGPQAVYFFITEILDTGTTFRVYPIPNAASSATNLTALSIRVSLCPTNVASYLPNDAFNLMRRTIKSIALRELYTMDGMPWHNEDAATKHDLIARQGKQDLRVQREFGWGKSVAQAQTGGFGMWSSGDSSAGNAW